ncbi:MAG: TIM barrel protein [Chloroflexi bacterium]|nr:TIM barrel protein [Chloroflexota bacterium]
MSGKIIFAENIDDPHIRPLLGRGADCRDLCAAVDSPAFRLIYDVGAPLFVEEDPLETLRVMAPYIAHVHVKNNRPLAPGEHTERYRDSVGGATPARFSMVERWSFGQSWPNLTASSTMTIFALSTKGRTILVPRCRTMWPIYVNCWLV